MNCDKCGVEISAQSAIAGAWCWRCGEKEEERLGKLLDERPTAKAAPDQTLSASEMTRAKEALDAAFVKEGLPPDVHPGATTYTDVRKDYEAESGHPAPAPHGKKVHK